MRGVLDYGDGVCAVAAWIGPDNGAARPQVHSSPQSKQRIGPIFPALHDAGARAELAFRFVAPMRTKMAWRLSMNRPFGVHPLGCPKRKDTLKRGHPTALCRFMAPMSVQSWRSKLPMNLSGVPALAGPVRLRECHRLKPGLQTRRGSWLRFTLERGSRLSMSLKPRTSSLGADSRRACRVATNERKDGATSMNGLGFIACVLVGVAVPGTAAPKPPALEPDARRDHWAFRPIKRPPVPAVRQAQWARTPVDSFILAKLAEKGMSPTPEADRRTLIRRATYDLTGLPPTVEEIEAFAQDTGPEAYARLLERLLASPR